MQALQNELHGEQQEEESDYYDVLHAPYLAGFSEKLAKDLRKLNIGVTFQKGNTFHHSFCKLKPPRSAQEHKNVIYCIGCKSCD